MNIIQKNILTVERGFIVHQVNCRSKMGSGIAGQIRAKWPVVYDRYMAWMDEFGAENLGCIQTVIVEPGLVVVNLAGQLNYGYDKKQYTDYDAILKGLTTLSEKIKELNIDVPVYIPYNMGCGLGGGEWPVVEVIIQSRLPDAIICKL